MASDDESIQRHDAPPGLYDEAGRARFFSDPAIDRLVSVMLRLAGEVWVLTERLDNLERLADQKGQITLDEIRAYAPDPDTTAERDAARDRYVHAVLGPLREVR